jgi:chromosome segregation ATPase
MSQNGTAFKASSEYLVEKNVTIQKSTKVMESELRSLQDKIQDLECKLNVTNSTSAATNKALINSRTQINLNNERDSSNSNSPLKP